MSGNGSLKARLLSQRLPSEDIEAWGVTVRVRAFSATELHEYGLAWSEALRNPKIKPGGGFTGDVEVDLAKSPNLNLLAAWYSLEDPDKPGHRLFDSLEEIGHMDPSPLKTIADTARRLSKIGDLEETVGESSATPNSDSSSRSQTTSESRPSENSASE